jgi:glycosyltransferase involved in cell wall biosynthesis
MDERGVGSDGSKELGAPRQHLKICAVAYAQSPHVRARLRCFAERGHTVYVITETAAPEIPGVMQLVPALDARTSSRLWFKMASWLGRKVLQLSFDDIWRPLAFVGLLRSHRPDVIHIHYAYAYYAWIAGIVGCKPLVVSVMGGDILFDEQGTPTPLGKWLTLNLLRQANYITSKSHHLTSVLNRLGGFDSKAERIVWGVPIRRFGRVDASALRQRLGLCAKDVVVLSAKILQPLYRIHLVVEAMPEVLTNHPNVVLLVMEYGADPAYRSQIVARVAELGLSKRVRFIGETTQDQMPAFYSLAHVMVSVPSSDGLPQSLLEGMACGTPNILSKLPRYEEIVRHRESAYFVEATPKDIADGVVELLENHDLHREIANTALSIVKREGDLDEQASRVEQRYLQLVKSIRPRPFRITTMLSTWRRYRTFSDASSAR